MKNSSHPHTPQCNRSVVAHVVQWSLALALAVYALAPQSARAQTATVNPPGQISYQGFLTDANGIPLATNTPANYNVTFQVYSNQTATNALWGESQTVTVDRGYFSVLLGQGSTTGSAPWSNNLTFLFNGPTASARYLGMTVTSLTNSLEIQPRLQLLATPYSLLAAQANSMLDSKGGVVLSSSAQSVVNVSNTLNTPNLNVTANLTASSINCGGVISANQFMGNGSQLTGLSYAGIGINTSTPGYALDVNGNIGLEGTHLIFDSASGVVDWGSGNLYFRTDNAQGNDASYNSPMTITAAGNVGIGTTSPFSQLQLAGTSGLTIGNQQAYAATALDLSLSSASGGYAQIQSIQYSDVSYGVLALNPNGGNVGVGTASPGQRFAVVGGLNIDSTSLNAGYLNGGNGGVLGTTGAGLTFGVSTSGEGICSQRTTGNQQYDLDFYTDYTRRMTILNNGNVGINNINANYALDVNGNIGLEGTHLIFDSANGVFDWGSGGNLYWRYDTTVGNYSTGNQAMYLTPAGGGILVVTYAIEAPIIVQTSDKNAKENFKDISSQEVLNKVAAMPIQEWQFKGHTAERHVGPMAQDFHAAFGLLGTNDTQISLGDESGVALSAIQALNTTIKAQQKEINELKAMVTELSKRR